MKSFRSPVDQRGPTSSSSGAIYQQQNQQQQHHHQYHHHHNPKWKYSCATSLVEKTPPSSVHMNGQQSCYGRQSRKERYCVPSNFPPTSPITIAVAAAAKNESFISRIAATGRGHSSASNNSASSSCSSARSTPSNPTTSLSSSFTSQTDEQTSQHFTPSNSSRDFSIVDMDDELFASMSMEVDAAVDYLTYLLLKAQFNVSLTESFRQSLTVLLMHHYAGHWYPDDPLRGSGYRCLRVNGVMHPLLANAAEVCAIPLTSFRRAFPAEFTIWIDPGNVNVRIGEDGSIGAFSKCDNESSGSLSPYFFAGIFSSATASPVCAALTPMVRRIVSPTTTATSSSNNHQQQGYRSCLNRTRLFQSQIQAPHTVKELSPSHKTSEAVLRSEAKHENLSKAGNVNNHCSNVRSSPVVGYRSEDHCFVERSSQKNTNKTINDESKAAVIDLSRRTTSFELCSNIHIGSKGSQVVSLPDVAVEA